MDRFKARLVILPIVTLLLAGCSQQEPSDSSGEDEGQGDEVAGTRPGEGRDGSQQNVTDNQSDEPDENSYWLVWIQGNETYDPELTHRCSVVFAHDVDEQNRSVQFREGAYDIDIDDVSFLVVTDHWHAQSACPLQVDMRAPNAPFAVRMGNYGSLWLDPEADGTLVVANDTALEPRDNTTLTYSGVVQENGQTYSVAGQFRIRHLGAWPKSGLTTY